MDRSLIKLLEEGDKSKVTKLIEKVEEKEWKLLIDQRAVKGRGDVCALIRAIFYGSQPSTKTGQERRLQVFKHCIRLLQSNDLNNKVASELVGILLLETDTFPSSSLVDLTTVFVESIKNGIGTSGKSLELFPKVLSALASQEVVTRDNCSMTGADYKSHVLNNLCSGRWDPGSVIHMAAMFRDVPLTSDELRHIISKILRLLSEVDLEELPPLVYQMLLLSTKGHKNIVLEGLASFFIAKDNQAKSAQENNAESEDLLEDYNNVDQLRHVEGTILLHITFAIKQDQELGRQFIKYLKAHQQSNAVSVLAPFNVALALSIAHIHRFQDAILELLRTTVLRSFKDTEKQANSQWVRDMVPDSCDVAHLLLDTVHNSAYGWDHVSQGLVQLGFMLMDSFGPKGVFGKVTADTSPTFRRTPAQRACQLGMNILQEIFKAQEMVRADILEQILNRVITKATVPVSHYIDLLAGTVRSAPQILLDSLPKVREAFDYLSLLPPPTAKGLMCAVQPLMKLSMSLKDGLMLTLRKAMFNRQLDSRKIAVTGFLLLLRRFRVLGGLTGSQASASFSSSQMASVDVHIPMNASVSEAVCLEILGSLRRCLSQQADVRLTLYEGLFDVLCENSQLHMAVIKLLVAHFKGFYEEKVDLQPPVKLERCIIAQDDQVFLGEPLTHLLSCLVQCVLKSREFLGQSDIEEDDCHLEEVEEMLDSMTRRLIKSDLEDFELDRSADFSTGTTVGVRNNIFAILAMGSYEALMEYNFRSSNFEPAALQNVTQLYSSYQRFSDLLKDKASGAGKRGRAAGGATTNNKLTTRSLLSIRFVCEVLQALYSDNLPDHQEGIEVLRQRRDFARYVLGVALQKLAQVEEKGQCDGSYGQDPSTVLKYCTSIAKVLIHHYTTDLQTPDDCERDRARVATMCLEGLASTIHIVCDRYQDQLANFLHDIDSSEAANLSDEDQVHKQIKRFQRLAVFVLTANEDEISLKEAIPLFNVIGWLSQSLSPNGQHSAQVQDWALKIATEQTIDDNSVTKSLVSLLFGLTVRHKNIAPVLREMAEDIHCELGDIEQDVELAEQRKYAVITTRTAAPTVLLLLLAQADRELDDIEWVISRLKARLTLPATLVGDEDTGVTQQEEEQKGICVRLGHMINTCHELIQSAVPVGPCADNLFRLVIRLYGSLTLLVKYNLALYAKGRAGITARFEKLVRLSGTNLTHYTYGMITYIQASQSAHLQQTTEKSKKKDQKVSSAVALAGKAKVLKETRMIPNLVFAIEQYEKFLIQLTKKSKVDLMEHMKLSTSRDFRINIAQLTAAFDEDESAGSSGSGSEGDVNDDDVTQDENNPPTTGPGNVTDQSSDEEQEDAPPNKKAKTEIASKKKGKLGTLSGKRNGKGKHN